MRARDKVKEKLLRVVQVLYARSECYVTFIDGMPFLDNKPAAEVQEKYELDLQLQDVRHLCFLYLNHV